MSTLALTGPLAGQPQNPLPLRLRLRAWWNGQDPRDLTPPKRQAHPMPMTPREADTVAATAAEPENAPAVVKPWLAERIAFVERLWGEGFHTPGGAEHVLELVRPLNLDESMTMLELGCGLGGCARTVAQTLGTWCTGVEWSPGLALAGVERSTRAGLVKKAAIQFHPADRMALKGNAYNRVFSKEALFTIPDKQIAIQGIADTLKSGGELCFTDYVSTCDPASSVDLRTWQEREPLGAHPWTLEKYLVVLASHGFDVRVTDDITEKHCQLIRDGWRRLVEEIKPGSVGPELMPIMVREAEVWARREALLRMGELRVYRFFALKPQRDPTAF